MTDLLIAGALIIELRRVETIFKATQSRIERVSRITVQSGAATSVVATTALVIYLINNESNISVAFAYALGRIYALTMVGSFTLSRFASR